MISGAETPGTPSCCHSGVRPCQWIRLGSSSVFSRWTRNRSPTCVLMPKVPSGWRMPNTDADLPFTSMLRRAIRNTVGRPLVPHSPWSPATAREEATRLLYEVAHGRDPATEKISARRATTVEELCDMYMSDAEEGRLLIRGGREKKATTIETDKSRI